MPRNELNKHSALLRSLPITGSRFYHKSCVTFALNRGTISWDMLGHGINGSGNLPPGYLKESLDQAEAAWKQTS